jgi:hypothetical protein
MLVNKKCESFFVLSKRYMPYVGEEVVFTGTPKELRSGETVIKQFSDVKSE